MKKTIAALLLLPASCFAQPSSLVDACGAVPRLYSVASLAALDTESGGEWRQSTYQVASEIMIGKGEADKLIGELRQNRDVALRLTQPGASQPDPDFMQSCMTEPRKYIPSYDRLKKAGRVN